MARKKRERADEAKADEAEADEGLSASDQPSSPEPADSEPAGPADSEPADSQADEQTDEQAEQPEAQVELLEADERLPSFARSYPDDPELRSLVQSFADGNYARVRDEAPALAARTGDKAVARAARDLRARIEPDPLAIKMLIGMGLLLAFLTAYFYTHRH